MGMAWNPGRASCEPPRKSLTATEASRAAEVVQWSLVRQSPQLGEARRAYGQHAGQLLRLRFLGPARSRPPLS
ncbi:hypothetical protein GGD63_006344 [Bradyrhizobium sp. cir1]|nr:hypothetical protein [Bradyrhizobium sp. cir1]